VKQVYIVGSGVAGLASAIRLSVKGHSVTVIESNSYAGGKLTSTQLGAYRFDAGPSLFTLPHLVDELFHLAGKDPRNYYSYVQLPVSCRYFFEDGIDLTFFGDRTALLEEIERKLNVDQTVVSTYLERSKTMYNATKRTFLEQSLHKPGNYFSADILKTILQIPNLGLFSSMHRINETRLKHPKLIQIFDRYATYNGSNPYAAPGILNLIPHLELGIGTFFPASGMHDITKSLVQLATELGVQFHFNERVLEIQESNKKVTGVLTDRQWYPADLVVCNSDVKKAYSGLLKTISPRKRTMSQEPSSSAMIFYWGVKREFPELDVHNIFFSADYRREFQTIFESKSVWEDPTVYVHIASKVARGDAPEGCENWFVMVNVPSNSGQDWDELRSSIRLNVINKLNRLLKIDLQTLIEEEDYLDPVRIENRTNSFAGALYGSSSNDRMAAFFRHPNFSSVEGLYFAGGSVHPGGGIPLCLLSAKIVSELIGE